MCARKQPSPRTANVASGGRQPAQQVGRRGGSCRRCRRPAPCRSGRRRRRRTAPPPEPPAARGCPCGIRPPIPQVTAVMTRVALPSKSCGAVGRRSGPGAGRGSGRRRRRCRRRRACGRCRSWSRRCPGPRGRWEATWTVPASSSPSLPRAMNGTTSTQIAAKSPKRTNGPLAHQTWITYRRSGLACARCALIAGNLRLAVACAGTTGTSGAVRTPRSGASAGRRGGRG